MSKVRTRFAPSPTGFQHIGGFRTAMYAWLLARHFGGDFILRIEDTDRERSVEGAVRYLIESLEWLGIDVDEGPSRADLEKIGEWYEGAPEYAGDSGPYIQSLRQSKYEAIAEQLVASGAAYRCDCTPEMIEKERAEQMARKETPGYSGRCRERNVSKDVKHIVRFRMPDNAVVTLDDAVRGRVTWESPPLREPVLLKSDGFPTYHLASVVDDHDMGITHVLRGEEWLPTAPLHCLLYDALGWQRPTFCHLATVLGQDGKKLSKRHGAAALTEYQSKGYVAEALLNYVVLVGWSPGEGDQEIFSREELIKKFSVEKLSSSNGVFDSDKLQWMNGVYLRSMQPEKFLTLVKPLFEEQGLVFDTDKWSLIGAYVQERAKLLTDVVPMADFLFKETIDREMNEIIPKGVEPQAVGALLVQAGEVIQSVTDWSIENVEAALKGLVEQLGMKAGQVFVPVRIAATGKKATPPLFESLVALGKERTVQRLNEAAAALG